MKNTKVEIKDNELKSVTCGIDIPNLPEPVRGDYGNGEASKYQLRSSIGSGGSGAGDGEPALNRELPNFSSEAPGFEAPRFEWKADI